MESHLSLNPLQANLQDLTQAATNLQADLATKTLCINSSAKGNHPDNSRTIWIDY